jgi:streptogramin lyase
MVTQSGTISTVAGNHSRAGQYYGDGGLATAAGLYGPVGVAVDASGNIYISDSGNLVIREVTKATGNISTVAGGTASTTPSVVLSDPYGLAVDSLGNLYIADLGNDIIRKLSGTNVTTVAGTFGYAGYTGDGAAAISARLNAPDAVAVDSAGNIYIADGLNFVIRKVDLSGNINTVAGNGLNGDSGDGGPATAAEIEQPWGVAVDSSGNLYISEINSVVRKVDTNGNISTVAGNVHLGAGYGGDGNVATAAMLDEPWGLAIDNSGNLLIADFVNNRVRKVGP